MKLKLASVYDTVAGVYCRPFCARSEAEAQRIFLAMCEQDETVSKAPSDYRLYVLGEFDEVEGVITGTRAEQVAAGKRPEPGRRGFMKGILGRRQA